MFHKFHLQWRGLIASEAVELVAEALVVSTSTTALDSVSQGIIKDDQGLTTMDGRRGMQMVL